MYILFHKNSSNQKNLLQCAYYFSYKTMQRSCQIEKYDLTKFIKLKNKIHYLKSFFENIYKITLQCKQKKEKPQENCSINIFSFPFFSEIKQQSDFFF